MPINLQGSGPITEGWGPAPQLHAPDLGSLVASILRNKLERDKMTGESIADTIKNVREERQSAQYLDAMKAAGLVPEGYDAGGFGGAKLGTGLAKMIQDKREFDALQEHRRAMEARIGGRGGSGGGGGGVDTGGPEIVEKDGIKYQKVITRNGVQYKRLPYQRPGGSTNDIQPSKTERAWTAPTVPGLKVYPDGEAETLIPDTPSAVVPDASPTPAPSDQAGGHAEGYGKTVSDADVEALAWARQHPDDPRSAAILDKLGVPH